MQENTPSFLEFRGWFSTRKDGDLRNVDEKLFLKIRKLSRKSPLNEASLFEHSSNTRSSSWPAVRQYGQNAKGEQPRPQ